MPIGIAALVVVSRTLHLRHTRLDHRIDWWGAAALTVGLVPLLLVAEQGRDWGWGSGRSIACYVIGGVGVVAFFLVERPMGDEALIPLALFQNRTVGIASIASVIIGMGHVRRHRLPAALPADRQGRLAHRRPACCCCR